MTGTATDIITKIATDLIATGSWADADTSVIIAGTPPARALRYTRAGEEIFLTFAWGYYGRRGTANSYTIEDGILVFVSSGWDATNHKPSGTCELLRVPLRSLQSAAYPTSGHGIAQLWLYTEADIFAIMVQAASGTSGYDSIGFLTFEREDAKEYDDLGSKVFIYADSQQASYYSSSISTGWGEAPYEWNLPAAWDGLRTAIRKYVHPFICAYPTTRMNATGIVQTVELGDNFQDGQDFGRTKLSIPVRARKSNGNSKVYMAFPVAYADASESTFRTPIKTLKAFFPVESGQGIADGDLINIPVSWNQGVPTTWQYIYKQLASPDGFTLDIAIKYGTV